MHTHPRPLSPHAPALIGCALLLAACSGETDQPEEPSAPATASKSSLHAWQPADDSAPIAPARVVQRIEPPEDLSSWRILASESWLSGSDEELPGGPRALRLLSGGRRRVFVPGHYPPADFDRVRVAVQLNQPQPAQMHVGLWRGEERVQLGTAFLPAVAQPQAALVDFAVNLAGGEAYDSIELEFTSATPIVSLLAIELLHEPLSNWLPPAGGPEAFLELDEDTRPAVGLSMRRPLHFEARLPAGEPRLSLHWGVPLTLMPPRTELELALSVRAEGRAPIEARSTLRKELAGSWQAIELELTSLAGSEVVVTARLFSDSSFPLTCALGTARIWTPLPSPPTVLLITSDTHRGDHLGAAHSGVEIQTPVLDALAQRGILFEDCWTSANVTTPSHVALMTARNPRDTGVFDNLSRLGPDAPTLARAFRDVGYTTWAAVSILHLRHESSGLAQGFDRLAAPDDGQWIAEETIQSLLEWMPEAEGRPLFCWLHVFDAHAPYAPPPSHDRFYYPEGRDPGDAALPALPIPDDQITPSLMGVRDIEFPLSQYRAEISYLDSELARVLDIPRVRAGLVAVTADHGESLGAHGTWFNHAGLYPDTLHVPLLLAGADLPAGMRLQHPVRQIDIGRTLLDLADCEAVDFPGANLTALYDGEEHPRFALASMAASASIQSGDWLFVLHLKNTGRGEAQRRRHAGELYQLSVDPDCTHDLVREDMPRSRRMRTALTRWLAEARPDQLGGRTSTDERMLAHLADLGYGTSGEEVDASALFDPDCDCIACGVFTE